MRVASSSNVIKVHETPPGDLTSSFQPISDSNGRITSFSWSSDGSWMVVVTEGGFPYIISFTKGVKILAHIKEIPSVCAVFPNNTRETIAVGTRSKEILYYDLKSRDILCMHKCRSNIHFLEFLANNEHLAAALSDGQVLLCDQQLVAQSQFCLPDTHLVTCLKSPCWSPNYIGGGSQKGMVAIYDCDACHIVYTLRIHQSEVTGLTYSSQQNNLMITIGNDGQLIFTDILTSGKVQDIQLGYFPTAVDLAYDGYQMAISGNDGKIYVYDTRAVRTPVNSFQAHSTGITWLQFQKCDNGDLNELKRINSSDFLKIPGKNCGPHGNSTAHVEPSEEIQTSAGILQENTSNDIDFPESMNQSVVQSYEWSASVSSVEARKIARQEIKQASLELHERLRAMMGDILKQVRHEALDLQISFGKSFVQMHRNVTTIKKEIFADDGQTSKERLIKENEKLKRELLFLKEKLGIDKKK